jgi:NAD+ synthase (glutamine-hydrolysing)
VSLAGARVPFGADLLFAVEGAPDAIFGIEICEDLWAPVPPSSLMGVAGATVLLNLSASNETVAKADYRRALVAQQSGRTISGYVYSSSGIDESTTDLVFGGHLMIAENGALLAEGERFRRENQLLVSEIDLDRLAVERLRLHTLLEATPVPAFRRVACAAVPA